jgi:16S rRNA C967 or C1407 C5-methylase (RsmB/RsmF family)
VDRILQVNVSEQTSVSKGKNKTGNRGAEGFHRYYGELYPDRWTVLRAALAAENTPVGWTLSGPLYYLDPASLVTAHLLPLGERNVDLCAAPGGKALILAHRMSREAPPEAVLVANERSRERRARLHRVLQEHLPAEIRERVQTTGHDATRWGVHQPESCDAILADVPCSSERHVLAAPDALAQWSESRVTRLAIQQFAILAAAIDSLRPGGHVLYSTCALTPRENDAVLEKALKRRKDKVELVLLEPGDLRGAPLHEGDLRGTPLPPEAAAILKTVERTEFGLQFMPDRCGGAGPMYCALLRRKQPQAG